MSRSIMVTPGQLGERTEVRLLEVKKNGWVVAAIRYVTAELTTEEGQRELAAAVDELDALP